MADLFFPQLASGAVSQYPIKKTSLVTTRKNVLPDGNLIVNADPNGRYRFWQLTYTELGTADMEALETHFSNCAGPFRSFTFIDPTENMLTWSADLTNQAGWTRASDLQISAGSADPNGGTAGFLVNNSGQAAQSLRQQIAAPANYQYCFSLYAMSAQPSQISLGRAGSSSSETNTFAIGPNWTRIVSSGRLEDVGTQLTIEIQLAAGQQAGLFGAQLEAQISPSRYRPTTVQGGVYSNAHWAVEELTMVAEAPGLFSTTFSIEATLAG